VAITTYNNRLFPLPRQCSETDDGSSGTGRRKEESTEETDCEYQSDERGVCQLIRNADTSSGSAQLAFSFPRRPAGLSRCTSKVYLANNTCGTSVAA
jgi:hypothetical protein